MRASHNTKASQFCSTTSVIVTDDWRTCSYSLYKWDLSSTSHRTVATSPTLIEREKKKKKKQHLGKRGRQRTRKKNIPVVLLDMFAVMYD